MMRKNAQMIDIDWNILDLLKERHRVVHDLQPTLYSKDMLKESANSIKMFITIYSGICSDASNSW